MLRSRLLKAVASCTGIFLILVVLYPQISSGMRSETSSCRTFRETGKTMCDKFLQYWEQHGGLLQFGYPVSETFTEVSDVDGKSYTVQYFERAVMELHPDNQPPYDVLLMQLGTLRMADKYPGMEPGQPNRESLPVYPQAINLQIQKTSDDLAAGTINTTTYETAATLSDILDFYREVLAKNNWYEEPRIYPDVLHFIYSSAPGDPVYGLGIVAEVRGTIIYVTLTLRRTFGM